MIPKLRIVPVSSIIPAMDYAVEKVDYIREIIEHSGNIGTPIPLIDFSNKNYLLLDDSAILKAAYELNINYLPAQIALPEQIKEIRAEIVIEDFEPGLVSDFMAIFPRTANVSNGRKGQKNIQNHIRLTLSKKGEKDIVINFPKTNSARIPAAFFNFFDFLKRHCRIVKRLASGRIRTANTKSNNNSWSLEVQDLSLGNIVSAVEVQRLFPAGLLRFDYGCRIVGVEYPVSILNEKVSIREKERFLNDLINYRLNSGHPEYIGGGVYLLNYLAKK